MKTRKPGKSPNAGSFKKGDPRINKAGNLNAAAQSYEIRFRNALANGLAPEEFAGIVIEDVRKHRPGAREFYADRLMGKVAQPVGLSGEVTHKLSITGLKKSLNDYKENGS